MGIPGIWEILCKAMQTRSLTELAFLEGFDANRRGVRTLTIGVDASIWLNQTQAVFHVPGMHYQVGENPELHNLFYRIACFRKLPVHLVFVFDGEGRPAMKRGINVCTKAHALTNSFQELIEQYSYSSHTAPGEAEAELAMLNAQQIIDGVLTDDADTLVFGATHLIRNLNVKEDGDMIKIYTAQSIQSTLSLTAGGILLLALLCGGDYDPVGLRGCGMTTAYSLARAGYGDDLLDAARTCTKPELQTFLEKWRKCLCTIFRYNDAGHLSRRQVALANHVSDSFPNPEVLLLYAKPLTSWSPGRKQPDTTSWIPREVNLSRLAAFCERSFTWGTSEGIFSCFQEHVWPGMALHGLVKEADINPTTALAAHVAGTITEGTFCLSSILCIVQRQKGGKNMIPGYRVEVQTGRLSSATRSGLRGLRTFGKAATKKYIQNKEKLPGKMVVWIPSSVLDRALPALVARFQQARKAKARSVTTSTSTYKAILSTLLPVPGRNAAAPGSSTVNAIYID